MEKLRGALVLTISLMLVGCGSHAAAASSAVGVYELDRQAFADMLMGLRPEAEREAIRPVVEQQAAQAIGTAEFMADGRYSMRMAVPAIPEVNDSGTWKLYEDKLSLLPAKAGKERSQVAMFRDGVITLENPIGPTATIKVIFRKKGP